MKDIKTAQEIRELQREKSGAYEKVDEIVKDIEIQATTKPEVTIYVYPFPISIYVYEILKELGFKVITKKDDITKQVITEIKW